MAVFDLSNPDLPEDFDDEASATLVLIALDKAKLPDATTLHSYLHTTWDDIGELGEISTEENYIGIEVPGGSIGCELVQEPLPEEDLEVGFEASWYWPEARERMQGHTAYIAIFAGSLMLEDIELFLLVTKVAAAMAQLTDASGIVWGTSGMLHEPGMFLEQATGARHDNIPIMLWVGGLFARASETELVGYTSGMQLFDLMDIETAPSIKPPSELFTMMMRVAAYLVTYGPVIEDGEALSGETASNAVVYHRPSGFEDDMMVYRLEF